MQFHPPFLKVSRSHESSSRPRMVRASVKAIGYLVRSIIIWTCNCRWMLNNSWVHKVNSWIANRWQYRGYIGLCCIEIWVIEASDCKLTTRACMWSRWVRGKIVFFWTLSWGFMSISMIMVRENFLCYDVPISTVVSCEFACRRLSNLRV